MSANGPVFGTSASASASSGTCAASEGADAHDTPDTQGRRWWRPRTLLAWAVLVSVAAAGIILLTPGKIRDTTWNDSYRYITAIERYLGKSDADAHAVALDYYCTDLARTTATADERDAVVRNCLVTWIAQGGLAPNTPQFNEIFTSRPGYPLLAVPFVAVLGLDHGLTLLAELLTLLAGWGVLVLIRLGGGSASAALSGMVLCFVLPTWYWLQQFLTESPTLVCTIAVLIGAMLVLRGRTRLGLVASTVAYVCGFVVRYSTFSVQAGCMALTIGLLAWSSRSWRDRRAGVLAAYSGGVFVVLTVLPVAFGWPGFRASLEDTFTNHFLQPTPPNLYGKWLRLNWFYWPQTAKDNAHAPLVPALVILSAVLLWRYRRGLGAVAGAAALTGLANAAAHPMTNQLDRLYFQVYLLPICGLPILADLILRRIGPVDGARTGPRAHEEPGGSFVRGT